MELEGRSARSRQQRGSRQIAGRGREMRRPPIIFTFSFLISIILSYLKSYLYLTFPPSLYWGATKLVVLF